VQVAGDAVAVLEQLQLAAGLLRAGQFQGEAGVPGEYVPVVGVEPAGAGCSAQRSHPRPALTGPADPDQTSSSRRPICGKVTAWEAALRGAGATAV
jgi:hypothetical protein